MRYFNIGAKIQKNIDIRNTFAKKHFFFMNLFGHVKKKSYLCTLICENLKH